MKTKKIVFFAGLVLFGMSFTVRSQQMPPNTKVVKTLIVDAPATEVWASVGTLVNLERYLPNVFGSSSITPKPKKGATRQCVSVDGSFTLIEEITAYEPNEMFYSYSIPNSGMPVTNMNNSSRVVPLGSNQSMIIWTSYFEYVDNPNMTEEALKAYIGKTFQQLIDAYAKEAESA